MTQSVFGECHISALSLSCYQLVPLDWLSASGQYFDSLVSALVLAWEQNQRSGNGNEPTNSLTCTYCAHIVYCMPRKHYTEDPLVTLNACLYRQRLPHTTTHSQAIFRALAVSVPILILAIRNGDSPIVQTHVCACVSML